MQRTLSKQTNVAVGGGGESPPTSVFLMLQDIQIEVTHESTQIYTSTLDMKLLSDASFSTNQIAGFHTKRFSGYLPPQRKTEKSRI